MKAPLGLLIRGSFKDTTKKLKKLVEEKKPVKLISVGDKVSRNIIENGIYLDLAIIDNKVMRKPITPIKFEAKPYQVRNPPGILTDEAWKVTSEAINHKKQAKVQVKGEEDLLTLVAVLSAPNGSIVVYGQPRKGIVVINVTEESKKKMRQIVDKMNIKLSKD